MGKHNNRKRFRGGAVRSNPMDIEEPLAENGSCSPTENPEDVLTKITSQLQSGTIKRLCGLCHQIVTVVMQINTVQAT